MAVSDYVINKIFIDCREDVNGSRIDKVLKVGEKNIAFILYKNGKSKTLLLSLTPTLPLFLYGESLVSFVEESNGFYAVLKKYIEHGTIIDIEKKESDRIIKIKVKKRLPTYVNIITTLVFEMIPMRANMILLNEESIIIDALYKSEGFEGKRIILKGIKYKEQETYDKNIYLSDTLDSIKYKVSRKEYKYLSNLSNEDFFKAKEEMNHSDIFYLSDSDLSLLPIDNSILINSSNLFNEFLFIKEQDARKKHYENIISFISKKVVSLKKKISKLNDDLKKCENADIYKEYGSLLYMVDSYKKGDDFVVVENIKIPLKKDKNLIENANYYFKMYKKAKSGIEQINIQIDKTNKELSYFEELLSQCEFATVEDYKDIILQLEEDKYILNKEKKLHSKKKKENKVFNPHIIEFDGIKIGYGISSYQNDYLTFTLAHKEDYFLHVKDKHGPHVIVFNENPSSEVLLLASEVALYFASEEGGDVYYTKRKNVKKIPSKLGLVEINDYKTIHIKEIREETKSLLKKMS